MNNKEYIIKLIDYYFQTSNIQIKSTQIENVTFLINEGVLKSKDNNQIEINLKSKYLLSTLWEYIENDLGEKLSIDIHKAYDQVDKLEKIKKGEYSFSNIINAYSALIDAFKTYIVVCYHNKGIINFLDFLKSLKGKKKIYKYDKYILEATFTIQNINVEAIYDILSLLKSNKHITRVPNFCLRLGKEKPNFAHQLYDYSLLKEDENDFYILSNLLIGLYDVDPDNTFIKSKELLNHNRTLAYFTLGRLKYISSAHISECFEIANDVDLSNVEALLQIPYIYKSLIENNNTREATKNQCFAKMGKLFTIENEQLRNTIFLDCQMIEGFEAERYKLFIEIFLAKSANYFSKNGFFFINYTNPDYFFDFFIKLYTINYNNNGTIFNVDIVKDSLSHFWDEDRDKTEAHLLDLISHDMPYLRIGAVDLIRSRNLGICDIDLHKLKTELCQLRALEALFFQSYLNIDDLLPLILTLHNSKFSNVVVYLQEQLSELIIEAYHDYVYNKIIEMVTDESFLEPIKQALNYYYKMKEIKSSINDLNPTENERSLMQFYFNLEREEKRKLMNKVHEGDNSFLSLFKNTIIVRGNSWKIGDNDVSPLGKFERSFPIDQRLYKNPDLFDFTHYHFNSQF